PRVLVEDRGQALVRLLHAARRQQKLRVLEIHLKIVGFLGEPANQLEAFVGAAGDEERPRVEQLRVEPLGPELRRDARVLERVLDIDLNTVGLHGEAANQMEAFVGAAGDEERPRVEQRRVVQLGPEIRRDARVREREREVAGLYSEPREAEMPFGRSGMTLDQ